MYLGTFAFVHLADTLCKVTEIAFKVHIYILSVVTWESNP